MIKADTSSLVGGIVAELVFGADVGSRVVSGYGVGCGVTGNFVGGIVTTAIVLVGCSVRSDCDRELAVGVVVGCVVGVDDGALVETNLGVGNWLGFLVGGGPINSMMWQVGFITVQQY